MPSEPMAQRVKKVFGDLGSREASKKAALENGVVIAGVHIPRRPDPPTNCCQNGCTECVWVLFKDEFLDFQRKKREARKRLCLPEYKDVPWPSLLGAEPANRRPGTVNATSGDRHRGRVYSPSPFDAEYKGEPEEDESDGLDPGLQAFVETERRINAAHKKKLQEAQESGHSNA